jgi:PadR family transcriptional regulator PadR
MRNESSRPEIAAGLRNLTIAPRWRDLVSQGIVWRMADGGMTEFRRGVVGPCILALLASGPRYGLQIVQELDAAGRLLSSQGTIYPLLNRLHEAGLVSSRWETEAAGRPRRYYDLTDDGRRELATFRDEWTTFSAAVGSLLASIPPESEAS